MYNLDDDIAIIYGDKAIEVNQYSDWVTHLDQLINFISIDNRDDCLGEEEAIEQADPDYESYFKSESEYIRRTQDDEWFDNHPLA